MISVSAVHDKMRILGPLSIEPVNEARRVNRKRSELVLPDDDAWS